MYENKQFDIPESAVHDRRFCTSLYIPVTSLVLIAKHFWYFFITGIQIYKLFNKYPLIQGFHLTLDFQGSS